MMKATSLVVAAAAALTLSGGVFAQAAGGTSGSTASPANQVNRATSTDGYGTPGMTNSDSGMGRQSPNTGLPSAQNSTAPSVQAAPTSNNTLATPSVKSPVSQ
jgi:hypothetical protein